MTIFEDEKVDDKCKRERTTGSLARMFYTIESVHGSMDRAHGPLSMLLYFECANTISRNFRQTPQVQVQDTKMAEPLSDMAAPSTNDIEMKEEVAEVRLLAAADICECAANDQ